MRRCATLSATFRAEYPVRPTLYLLALMMILTGCGYKGPLYLPDQKPASRKPAEKSAPAPAPGTEESQQP